jgi:hypothetical protein
MRQLGPAALVLIVLCISMGGGAGCTLLLDTSANPTTRCETDGDCARFANAACDDARKQCVPRLPYVDSGAPDTGAGGTSGGLTCELAFDNAARINLSGPDGGLRPLPDGP